MNNAVTPHFHNDFTQDDKRGSFSKFWTDVPCVNCDEDFLPKEIFYSNSLFGVIRGFHFQNRPARIAKIVKVLEGSILDVSFNLDSSSNLDFHKFDLTVKSNSLYIPKNFAHAFQVTSKYAVVLYVTDGSYSPTLDDGVHWTSYKGWKKTPLIISDRDSNFRRLDLDSSS